MTRSPIPHDTIAFDGYRVLRRTDRSPSIPIRLVGYDETVESMDVLHPDGVRAATAFLRSPNAIARHTKLGWSDVTPMWDGSMPVPKPAKEAAKASVPKTTTSGRRTVRRKATA